eukprot:751831-Hanusia_phi.AAC.2
MGAAAAAGGRGGGGGGQRKEIFSYSGSFGMSREGTAVKTCQTSRSSSSTYLTWRFAALRPQRTAGRRCCATSAEAITLVATSSSSSYLTRRLALDIELGDRLADCRADRSTSTSSCLARAHLTWREDQRSLCHYQHSHGRQGGQSLPLQVRSTCQTAAQLTGHPKRRKKAAEISRSTR